MYGTGIQNITPPVLAPKKICVYIYTQKKNRFAYMRIAYWYTQIMGGFLMLENVRTSTFRTTSRSNMANNDRWKFCSRSDPILVAGVC